MAEVPKNQQIRYNVGNLRSLLWDEYQILAESEKDLLGRKSPFEIAFTRAMRVSEELRVCLNSGLHDDIPGSANPSISDELFRQLAMRAIINVNRDLARRPY